MEFDPKRAARVGAKKIRQRTDARFAKKEIYDNIYFDNDREEDEDSELKDLELNFRAADNRKYRYYR